MGVVDEDASAARRRCDELEPSGRARERFEGVHRRVRRRAARDGERSRDQRVGRLERAGERKSDLVGLPECLDVENLRHVDGPRASQYDILAGAPDRHRHDALRT